MIIVFSIGRSIGRIAPRSVRPLRLDIAGDRVPYDRTADTFRKPFGDMFDQDYIKFTGRSGIDSVSPASSDASAGDMMCLLIAVVAISIRFKTT
jgi:hypothetical protein